MAALLRTFSTLVCIYCLCVHAVSENLDETCIVRPDLYGSGCNGGFLLRVQWYGRLGNNLIQLAHVLHLAETTSSEITTPESAFLNRTHWDFRASNVETCQLALTHDFFQVSVCPSLLEKSVFPAATKRRKLQLHVLPAFQIPEGFAKNALVVHVRSGDVFNSTPEIGAPRTYTQPPMAFYIKVLQLPELARLPIILCTEDLRNPVVGILKKLYKKRLSIVTDLSESIGTILRARHLVLGQSSFSEMLGMMAVNLQTVYIPFCVGRENLYVDLRVEAWNVSGLCFEYDNYIALDDWHNTDDQRHLMKTLPLQHAHSFALAPS